MSKKNNILGNTYGKLTVIAESESIRSRAAWLCKCECGNTKIIQGTSLISGRTKSCGCYQAEAVKRSNSKHELSYSSEYGIYKSMIQRCTNPKNKSYCNYGGKGITICKEWLDSFEQFYEDMGPKPNKNSSIERIDYNGNYEPSNCKWEGYVVQGRNKSSTKLSLIKAREIRSKYSKGASLTELGKEYGVTKQTIYSVVNNKTWKE